MNRKPVAERRQHATHQAHAVVAPDPRAVPIIALDPNDEGDTDQPFQEGAHDAIDPELRHRLISEAAYGMYVRRGYADGFDIDDWLAAEAEIDHVLLKRTTEHA